MSNHQSTAPNSLAFRKIEARPSFPELEQKVLARWKGEQTFERSLERSKGRPEFVFYDGPPFPTGSPHHGTLFVTILKDVVPRYMTMRGYYVPRGWGWDCHGLPIETQAEKNLGISEKREIEQGIGVKAFNDECRRIVSTYNAAWETYIDRIGRWVDFAQPYKTLDPSFMESVLWAFSECHKKGLIFKDYRVSPYCYRCQTPLSISETRLDDATRSRQDRTVVVKFALRERPRTYVLAWTTTPWTLPANLALAVGPELRYLWVQSGEETYLIGAGYLATLTRELKDLQVLSELSGAEVVASDLHYSALFPYAEAAARGAQAQEDRFRIVPADFVGTDEGTGIVHLAPAFGEDDYWTCKTQGISAFCPVDERGCYTAQVSDFAGKNVHEANADVIRLLKQRGLLLKDETLEHNYPHCWRCRNPLIYKALDAWYLSVDRLKSRLLACNNQINWYPETVQQGRFGKWLENARDWNISRNRFWATPIPVWDCAACGAREVLGSIAEIEARAGHKVPDLHKEFLDQVQYACACGGQMKRTPEVLDGWFESGSMPYGQFHYPFENAEHFKSHFPADFIVEYTGQIRGWFYNLHVLSCALFDKPAFKHCLVHGTLLAADGKKMSKSLKNYTDPLLLMDKYGADPLRMYLLSSPAVQMADLSFRDEGVDGMIKSILLPLWNALAFFTSYAEVDALLPEELDFSKHDLSKQSTALSELDRYIISETELLIEALTQRMDRYAIHEAAQLFAPFLDTLNNWYIRRSRARVWSAEARSADKLACYATLYRVLSRLTRVLAPFCPFIAESVWQRLLYPESVHLEAWPSAEQQLVDHKLSREIAAVRGIISTGLALRAREKIRVRQPLARARVALSEALDLNAYRAAILEELNVKQLEFVQRAEEIAERVGKAQAKLLGPKYGAQVQNIIRDVKAGNFSQQADGSVLVAGVTLLPGEVEISFVGKEGLAVESSQGIVVALDVEISPELALEGQARDLVRFIQELRKEADLQLSDRIRLRIEGAEQLVAAHAAYLQAETLTTGLHKTLSSPLLRKVFESEGQQITVELEVDKSWQA
jgi:isoleucyl-tRNA synthetase